MHGSVITEGETGILLTGHSGAGKSTTAHRFLAKGYHLVTDDVAATYFQDDAALVAPAYGHQKLWEDVLPSSGIGYTRVNREVDGRTKYTVDREQQFWNAPVRLRLIVELVPADIEYVQHGTEFINTVEAVSTVHMIGVHHRWLKKYASDHTPLLKFLLEVITQKFYVKSSSLSFNLLYPVEVRFASYLLSVCFEENETLATGRLSTAHLMDAANLIGTSYRHLNRVIQHLSKDGLIERHNGFILVKDKDGLSAIAGNNSIYE